jgi:hypothetical protein
MVDDENEWLEPDDQMGLWEHQGQPLTVRWLMVALAQVGAEQSVEQLRQVLVLESAAAELPVEVEFYDGTASRRLQPMHIDVRAAGRQPSAVVITVV